MYTTYYCNVYSGGETYRQQVIRVAPGVIKSNYLPASNMSAVGYYNSSLDGDTANPNQYVNIAREFMLQPQQSIGVKRV
jgi:hypothetical protein